MRDVIGKVRQQEIFPIQTLHEKTHPEANSVLKSSSPCLTFQIIQIKMTHLRSVHVLAARLDHILCSAMQPQGSTSVQEAHVPCAQPFVAAGTRQEGLISNTINTQKYIFYVCVCVPCAQPLVAAGTRQKQEDTTSNNTHLSTLFYICVCVCVPCVQPLVAVGTGQKEEGLTSDNTQKTA